MNVRQFAKHIGVSHPAILKAIERGRLSASVRRDERGRVVEINPDVGALEWSKGAGRPNRRREAAAVAAPLGAESSRRLAEIVARDLNEIRDLTVALVPPAIEGVIGALRGAGVDPTDGVLTDVLDLDREEDRAIAVEIALNEIVDTGLGRGTAEEQARCAGADAAAAWLKHGGSDGIA